jgi:hypothetical protein
MKMTNENDKNIEQKNNEKDVVKQNILSNFSSKFRDFSDAIKK